MSETKDGGPAFPENLAISPQGDVHSSVGGMSLRDWFAGQFLAGAAASPDNCGPLNVSDAADQFDVDAAMRAHWSSVCRCAFIAADAMLAARATPSPEATAS